MKKYHFGNAKPKLKHWGWPDPRCWSPARAPPWGRSVPPCNTFCHASHTVVTHRCLNQLPLLSLRGRPSFGIGDDTSKNVKWRHWGRRFVVKTVFPWVASRVNMRCLPAGTHNRPAVCLHAAHIAALRRSGPTGYTVLTTKRLAQAPP